MKDDNTFKNVEFSVRSKDLFLTHARSHRFQRVIELKNAATLNTMFHVTCRAQWCFFFLLFVGSIEASCTKRFL